MDLQAREYAESANRARNGERRDSLLQNVDDVLKHSLLGRRVLVLVNVRLVPVGRLEHAVLEVLDHVVSHLVEVVVVALGLASAFRLFDDGIDPLVEPDASLWKQRRWAGTEVRSTKAGGNFLGEGDVPSCSVMTGIGDPSRSGDGDGLPLRLFFLVSRKPAT